MLNRKEVPPGDGHLSNMIKILESKEPINPEYLVITYINLGSVDKLLGKYNKALEYFQ